jgi:hypothetical protein
MHGNGKMKWWHGIAMMIMFWGFFPRHGLRPEREDTIVGLAGCCHPVLWRRLYAPEYIRERIIFLTAFPQTIGLHKTAPHHFV